jgi:hypothetical protein
VSPVARFAEDPHPGATTWFGEITDPGFDGSYPRLTRLVWVRALRSACEPSHPAKGRPVGVVDHPAGQESQWDRVELSPPPAAHPDGGLSREMG